MTAAEAVAEALRDSGLEDMAEPSEILASLKASGFAVVELPKPLYGPDGAGGYGFPESVSTCYGRVWEEDCDMDPDEAEALAASLLAACAAADAAEVTP